MRMEDYDVAELRDCYAGSLFRSWKVAGTECYFQLASSSSSASRLPRKTAHY